MNRHGAELFSLLALALAVPAGAAPQGASAVADDLSYTEILDLDRSLRLAVQNNSQLLAAEQDVIIAQQRVKEARLHFLPQATLGGTITKANVKYPQVLQADFGEHIIQPNENENLFTTTLRMVQPIYVGGRITNTYRLAQAALQQARTRYDAVKRDVALSLKQSFYALLYSREVSASASSSLVSARGIMQSLRLEGWDDVEAFAVLSKMESEVQASSQRVQEDRLSLLRALNKELNTQVEITGELKPQPVSINLSKAMVWAMELRPELKGEAYKAEMDAIAVNLAMSRRSPTVMLGASYDVTGNTFPLSSNSWETTLSVQLPLSFDFWPQIEQRRAEQRQGELNRAGTQDRVRMEVRRAHEDLVYWQTEVDSRQAKLRSLEERFAAVSAKAKPSLSALRAYAARYELHKSYLEAVKNQLSARARLEWALVHDLSGE